jgi:hypothetical protein
VKVRPASPATMTFTVSDIDARRCGRDGQSRRRPLTLVPR